MSLPIYVDAHSGYKSNERPKSFRLDEDWNDITSIDDRWHEPDSEYFKVVTTDGKTYLLRYEQQGDVWTLQGDFDGADLMLRPGLELITVDAAHHNRGNRLSGRAGVRCPPRNLGIDIRKELLCNWIYADAVCIEKNLIRDILSRKRVSASKKRSQCPVTLSPY
jgi:hypothetical protein